MSHLQSQINQIQEEKEKNKKIINTNINNGINMDSSKQNFDLNLINDDDDEKVDKIANLLCDPDNDDKIVNISKLNESLSSEDRNKKTKINEQIESNTEIISEEDINNSKPIINVSHLEIPSNLQNESKNDNNQVNNKLDNNAVDNNYKNSVNSTNSINKDINKIIIKNESLLSKSRKSIQKKILLSKIMLTISLISFVSLLLYIIFK